MSSQIRLFVGNLPENTHEKDLKLAFSAYGEVVNLDLKSKSVEEPSKRNFGFITLSCSHEQIESCIRHFTHHNYKGQKLYVTRARESFLERLERERQQEQQKNLQNDQEIIPNENPVINLSEKLNPRKRKVDPRVNETILKKDQKVKNLKKADIKLKNYEHPNEGVPKVSNKADLKKQDADNKRMESIKKKRQEFKEKQTIIKTGLHSIDNVKNKRIIFSDEENSLSHITNKKDILTLVRPAKKTVHKTKLFDENNSDDEINFDIKKQYEGKQGQKILDLQSRFKSDKRFVLDERFIEDAQNESEDKGIDNNEIVELGPDDEKARQLDILQDVLGVAIKRHAHDPVNNKKTRSKLGMLRFDPTQPDHEKFLAPVEEKEETTKKPKKKRKDKQEDPDPEPYQQPQTPGPEVSKEQFYKISDTLKETIEKPTTFSLRSLFGNNEEVEKGPVQQETGFIALEVSTLQNKKVKNPLNQSEKNPFMYDSSDSEEETKDEAKLDQVPEKTEVKAVWKENLFFSKSDHRFKEGLAFFNKISDSEVHKERRELKSLMKKRIYNKERKNQMFQKKIGGKKKTMKKIFRKKS